MKKVLKIAIIVILVILLFPQIYFLKDGGSHGIRAVSGLYNFQRIHCFSHEKESDEKYKYYDVGFRAELFGITIYENTRIEKILTR